MSIKYFKKCFQLPGVPCSFPNHQDQCYFTGWSGNLLQPIPRLHISSRNYRSYQSNSRQSCLLQPKYWKLKKNCSKTYWSRSNKDYVFTCHYLNSNWSESINDIIKWFTQTRKQANMKTYKEALYFSQPLASFQLVLNI